MYLGDYLEDSTVYGLFTTNDGSGARASFSATLEEADIVIFKDGSAMTLDASTITITSEPGSRTGVHVVSVDTSNDADFTTGSDYAAVLYASDETVDSQAPAGVLFTWSIENRTVDADRIDGSAAAATTLKNQMDGLVEFTASAATSTTVTGTSGLTDDHVNGMAIWCYGGTGAHQARQVVDYVSSTGVFTVDPAFTTTLSTDSTCQLIPIPPATTTASYAPEVGLVDDAITSAKYDQSTAYPLADSDGTALTEAGGTGDQFTAVPYNSAWDAEVGDAVLDEVVEGSYTLRELIRIFASALAGKASGLGTTSAAFRDLADSKDRIAATVDADGNRSAVTLDGT